MTNARLLAAAVLALSSGSALAQVVEKPVIGGAGEAAGVIKSNPFSVANIDPLQPFGAVDVTMAGANAESMRTWAASLQPDLKTEISQRCDVISTNFSTFPADAVGFCSTWSTVQGSEILPLPVTPSVPGAL